MMPILQPLRRMSEEPKTEYEREQEIFARMQRDLRNSKHISKQLNRRNSWRFWRFRRLGAT